MAIVIADFFNVNRLGREMQCVYGPDVGIQQARLRVARPNLRQRETEAFEVDHRADCVALFRRQLLDVCTRSVQACLLCGEGDEQVVVHVRA